MHVTVKYNFVIFHLSGTVNDYKFTCHNQPLAFFPPQPSSSADAFVMQFSMQEIYQERVVSRRQAEFDRLRKEREERISRILQSRRQERERLRKLKYYLMVEEERQQKLREEEEARKHEGNYFSYVCPGTL